MSFWSSIGDFFTGGTSNAGKVIDDVSSGIDKMFFTDQEKSEASIKGFELLIQYQQATLPQNKARRQIAMIMLAYWLLLGVLYVVSIIFGFSYKKELYDYITTVTPYIGAIFAFYFLKRMIPGVGGNANSNGNG